jgi:hypothetical protein
VKGRRGGRGGGLLTLAARKLGDEQIQNSSRSTINDNPRSRSGTAHSIGMLPCRGSNNIDDYGRSVSGEGKLSLSLKAAITMIWRSDMIINTQHDLLAGFSDSQREMKAPGSLKSLMTPPLLLSPSGEPF